MIRALLCWMGRHGRVNTFVHYSGGYETDVCSACGRIIATRGDWPSVRAAIEDKYRSLAAQEDVE